MNFPFCMRHEVRDFVEVDPTISGQQREINTQNYLDAIKQTTTISTKTTARSIGMATTIIASQRSYKYDD